MPQNRHGYQTKSEIKKIARATFARDNLAQAFAGKENHGRHGPKDVQKHSTNVKSRRTKQSKYRTPKR